MGPYGIPLRSLFSKDIENLGMAGRNISSTHAALGTVRVMGTTALMGQALGVAAAIAHRAGQPVTAIAGDQFKTIQQTLLRDGCFLRHTSLNDPNNLAPSAQVTASSTAPFTGTSSQEDRWMGINRDTALLIPVDGGPLETVSLSLKATEATQINLRLVRLNTIWDYSREDKQVLAKSTLDVTAGTQTICWQTQLQSTGTRGYVRLEICANSKLSCQVADNMAPGGFVMEHLSPTRYRSGPRHSLVHAISPAQAVYDPAEVLEGATRPVATTNRWISDPQQAMPQWLQLSWEQPQTITTAQLTFPGHIVHEYHGTPPLFKHPQIPADFTVEAWINNDWQVLETIFGNYQRHCRITFKEPVTTAKLRVVFSSTNGSASAEVCEFRAW